VGRKKKRGKAVLMVAKAKKEDGGSFPQEVVRSGEREEKEQLVHRLTPS